MIEGVGMNDESITAFDVLDRLSAAYFGKQMFFMQDDGYVYNRDDGGYYDLEHAIREFEHKLFWFNE